MDPLLRQFHRQYLQQVTNLTYPPPKLLAHPDVQRQLFRHFFFDGTSEANLSLSLLPPPEYQRRVLKRLVGEIVREVGDGGGDGDEGEGEVSDDLMGHMGYLSSVPKVSEWEAVRSPRVLSYFLPDALGRGGDVSTTSSLTYESKDEGEVDGGGGDDDGGSGDGSAQRVLIRECPQLLAAGSNVGLRTWEACLRLAWYLCTSSERDRIKGANVLELGAGTGLLSLICSMGLRANHVVATDGLEHVVQGIEDNVVVNGGRRVGRRLRMPLARVLDWTDLSEMDEVLTVDDEKVRFDYVLGADITYHPELLDPLASLLSILKTRFPGSKILISATVRNETTFTLWKQACYDHGLKVREINGDEDQWQCPPYRLQTGLFHEQAFPIVIMDIS